MKLKKLTKFVSLLTTVAICALFPSTNALTATAAEPTTYYVKHVDSTQGWKFQTGGWSDSAYNRDPYYMFEEIKDGDIVVVDSNGYDDLVNLSFSKHLSNLTIIKDSSVVVSATGIDMLFAHNGSKVAVTGTVKEAYLYDNASATFHNNVNTLTLVDTQGQATGNATASGTVGHVLRKTTSDFVYFDIYNVASGKLSIQQGELKMDAQNYSTTPVASSTNTTPTTQPTTSADEYDEVPKTGESGIILLLLGVATIALLGKHALKKI